MFDFFYRCFTHCWICLVCPLLCVHHGLQKVQYVSSVCDSVLFYQHTDLRLIIHRTFTQVGNLSQSEGCSSIMGYDGNKALALFSRTQRGNNRDKCLAHEHNTGATTKIIIENPALEKYSRTSTEKECH